MSLITKNQRFLSVTRIFGSNYLWLYMVYSSVSYSPILHRPDHQRSTLWSVQTWCFNTVPICTHTLTEVYTSFFCFFKLCRFGFKRWWTTGGFPVPSNCFKAQLRPGCCAATRRVVAPRRPIPGSAVTAILSAAGGDESVRQVPPSAGSGVWAFCRRNKQTGSVQP